MLATNKLRTGCHVNVSKTNPYVTVPKRTIVVGTISEGWIIPKGGSETEKYEEPEIYGIEISEAFLEDNGFVRSKLCDTRWNLTTECYQIKYDTCTKIITCSGLEMITHSGIFYVSQMEAIVLDAGIFIEFKI